VAKRRQSAADAGHDIGNDDRRASILSGHAAGHHEDAGPDDGPDAERRQPDRSEDAAQPTLVLGHFLMERFERFDCEESSEEPFEHKPRGWLGGTRSGPVAEVVRLRATIRTLTSSATSYDPNSHEFGYRISLHRKYTGTPKVTSSNPGQVNFGLT